MIQDPRTQRFSDSFANQWLSLDTLGEMPPDNKKFGFYNRYLEAAMLAETRQFLRYVLEEALLRGLCGGNEVRVLRIDATSLKISANVP